MLLPLKCVFVISVCAFLRSVFHDIIRTNEHSSQSFSLKWTIESNMHFKQVFKVYYAYIVGVMNGPLKFLTARKIFYLCSICSQNLNECSLARAPQIFALLARSQSKFFISARARKKIAVLGMLANARKDLSSPLIVFRLASIRFVILRSDFRFRTAVSRRSWSFHNSFKARWNH